jgi:hypothetical protein
VAVLYDLRSTACAINTWNLDAHLNLDDLSVLPASHVLQVIMYIAVLFDTFKAYGWFLLLPDFILLLIIIIIRFIRLSCGLHGRFSRAKLRAQTVTVLWIRAPSHNEHVLKIRQLLSASPSSSTTASSPPTPHSSQHHFPCTIFPRIRNKSITNLQRSVRVSTTTPR